MSDVLIPGGRDVRGTLEEPTDEPRAIVVACPPHPQQGGSRSDRRLRAVSDAVVEAGIACLRFDYGLWDEGYGEREDVRNAVRWAREEYDGGDDRPVGLFGYSFGASLALLAAADADPDAVAVLAPTARLADDLDALAALESLEAPLRVCYGERDTTVDWEPIVERAEERGDETAAFAGDHFFLGAHDEIATAVASFFERALCASA
ncbi:dienelactone hydrolase family protein [Natrinema thermotolerans]|uniref:Dienelactone hydrolase family protein n=1 Tax=Natrinema thermotolerans TaxID=121872 RepID=A0AAF0PDI4_9EURY|nr:CocE/NonD family hydrolase [Natrinema thermotolerans]QCC58145.1 alpha/beta hydrolase [Natrinema thermotolerans]WMT09252.1 dienelactone hydrolase family protein [Natrinema thermotolerans]